MRKKCPKSRGKGILGFWWWMGVLYGKRNIYFIPNREAFCCGMGEPVELYRSCCIRWPAIPWRAICCCRAAIAAAVWAVGWNCPGLVPEIDAMYAAWGLGGIILAVAAWFNRACCCLRRGWHNNQMNVSFSTSSHLTYPFIPLTLQKVSVRWPCSSHIAVVDLNTLVA